MSAPELLRPRRTDTTAVLRASASLKEALERLADELGYPTQDLTNLALELLLIQYGVPVPPVRPDATQ